MEFPLRFLKRNWLRMEAHLFLFFSSSFFSVPRTWLAGGPEDILDCEITMMTMEVISALATQLQLLLCWNGKQKAKKMNFHLVWLGFYSVFCCIKLKLFLNNIGSILQDPSIYFSLKLPFYKFPNHAPLIFLIIWPNYWPLPMLK